MLFSNTSWGHLPVFPCPLSWIMVAVRRESLLRQEKFIFRRRESSFVIFRPPLSLSESDYAAGLHKSHIIYGPNLRPGVVQNLRRKGYTVIMAYDELLKLIKG